MRYFFRVQDGPNEEDYLKPRALFRWEVTPDTVITERWNPATQGWVDSPDMIAWTGIGGDNDYVEITREDADAFRKTAAN